MHEDEYDKLLDLYVASGGLYATSLVAVIFGQFSVLTLLQHKGRYLIWSLKIACPVWVLIGVYVGIVVLGSFIVYYYLMFARLLDDLKSTIGLKATDDYMRQKVGEWKWLRGLREGVVLNRRCGVVAMVTYAIISVGALLAALCMR